jgi:N-acetyltransferase 10
MGYGTRALQLLRDYYEKKFVSGSSSTQQESTLFNMFKNEDTDQNSDDDNDVRPARELPPLLYRLDERKPESLDYIGVSFGVNVSLLKFWKKNGFVACYLRTTPNELTGDHSCIMLKNLRTTDGMYLIFTLICILFRQVRKERRLDLRLLLGIPQTLYFIVEL